MADLRKAVWDAVERHIEDYPTDGINAEGNYSLSVLNQQKTYVDGLRVGRLAAMNAIETREEEAKRKALEKIIHDRRWERDGYGQLKHDDKPSTPRRNPRAADPFCGADIRIKTSKTQA
jgi:hypothetical protein